ncbi:unnamed protein product [Dibothriocephalus latus]|uniref:Transporter n=1 Tax=Dibothriocephalus latus TaxID=60516 RepID=A0A3P7LS79_DIBLA|nr:unnamed protein product [Dibothriocephalus latus]
MGVDNTGNQNCVQEIEGSNTQLLEGSPPPPRGDEAEPFGYEFSLPDQDGLARPAPEGKEIRSETQDSVVQIDTAAADDGGPNPTITLLKGAQLPHGKREKWDSKLDFLLSVIGFAVDLGNIWRFPYICYQNGGGRVKKHAHSNINAIHFFAGIGFGICIIASFTAWYYNTIIAWAFFYMFDSMRTRLPWDSCDNWWNTEHCITVYEQLVDDTNGTNGLNLRNKTFYPNMTYFSSTEEYFYTENVHSKTLKSGHNFIMCILVSNSNRVLQIQYADGYNKMGTVRWEVALCLAAVFTIVYFALWKGVKSSGKVRRI